jgi:hypothetical protein
MIPQALSSNRKVKEKDFTTDLGNEGNQGNKRMWGDSYTWRVHQPQESSHTFSMEQIVIRGASHSSNSNGFFPNSGKNRCGIFGSGTPERKYRNILFSFLNFLNFPHFSNQW